MGRPCVFIRLSACNLRCSYCDTAYAYFEGREMTLSQIIQNIKKYNCSLVEVTGGEPLLQKNVLPLLAGLCDLKYEVLLETGGHVDISAVDRRVRRIMDIKCPSSNESDKNLWKNMGCCATNNNISGYSIDHKCRYVWGLVYITLWLCSPVVSAPVCPLQSAI